MVKLLGVGAPFIYGGATYLAFHRLDGSASEEAKEAISRPGQSAKHVKLLDHQSRAMSDRRPVAVLESGPDH